MASVTLCSLLLMSVLTGQGLSQCYGNTDCTGDIVVGTVADQRACCVGTNDGLSFSDGSNCSFCIVHGFLQAEYDVDEGERLDTVFQLNVKGTTQFGGALVVSGTVTSAPSGTASTSDFEMFAPISVTNSAEIRLFTANDEITLEFDDRVLLMFTPDNPGLIPGLEGMGEYMRDTATVHIIDNDLLEINFQERDYSFTEGASVSCAVVTLQYRQPQNPFTITLTSTTVGEAESENLGFFFTSDSIAPSSRATIVADFSNQSTTMEILPNTVAFEIPREAFTIVDDNIDEDEQSFAIVAEIGPDVPENVSCFQLGVGSTRCHGRRGATEIRIIDNDPMIIGFTERAQTVSEGAVPGVPLQLNVASVRSAEREHPMAFRLQESSTTLLETFIVTSNTSDAMFGNRENPDDPIEDLRILYAGERTVSPPLLMTITNDMIPENEECYTIRVFPVDVPGRRELFTCNEDDADTDSYFCAHTVCIEDDDVVVAFVEILYTVDESVGAVSVCVNLTRPEFDNFVETVNVYITDNSTSVYIPLGSPLATPDPPDFLSQYQMSEGSDYAQQTNSYSLRQESRLICFNQTIYDDVRVESNEYIGLILGIDNSTIFSSVQPTYDQASILIVDNDTAIVGLEETLYNVSGKNEMVELCAVVLSPDIICPIEFSFNISLLFNGSADTSQEFSSLVSFGLCQRRQCLILSILEDLVGDDNFTLTLARTEDLDDRISLNPVTGMVVIDVTNEEDVDCGDPPEVENGEIISISTRTTVDSVVTYKCSDGYQFQEGYNMSRTCLASGNWSEENILCIKTRDTCTGSDCDGLSAGELAAIISVAVLVPLVCLVAVAGCVVKFRLRKLKKSANVLSLSSTEEKSNALPMHYAPSPSSPSTSSSPSPVQLLKEELRNKNMLFPKSQLRLGRVVGQGESGLVYCGYIKGNEGNEVVAIKTGKALLAINDKDRLLKEVLLMLNFKHPNVMSLIGLSFDEDTPLVIMPFMSKGNVLGYVREHRENLFFTDSDNDKVQQAKKTSLGMCYQISKGMAYLAKFKFVHRDLAARNCMIDMNDVIKVSDFGLTEDMYSYNYFRPKSSESKNEEKLPIKWMAPESIETNIFDENTDVWSFGVTCWEVFTCGGVPYAGVPVTTLLSELRSGHRLDRPSNVSCSDDIWAVVTSCWSASPQERPKFASLVNTFANLLDSDPTYITILRETS